MVCGSRRKVDGSAQRGLTAEEPHTQNYDLGLLFLPVMRSRSFTKCDFNRNHGIDYSFLVTIDPSTVGYSSSIIHIWSQMTR